MHPRIPTPTPSPALLRHPQVNDTNLHIVDGNNKTIWSLLPQLCPAGYQYQVSSSANTKEGCIQSGPTPYVSALRR
jgi:hypothetical protein